MALLDDMSAYLSTQAGFLPKVATAGTDMFLGRSPDRPDKILVLRETGGEDSKYTMRNAALQIPFLQVTARAKSTDYAGAVALIQAAYDKFNVLKDVTINGTRYHWTSPVQPPFLIDEDENDRVVLGFNVRVLRST